MRVTVCQLADERDRFEDEWKALCAHVRDERSALVLLPELPFARWFPAAPDFDARVWQRAVDVHRRWEARLRQLGAPFVVGTRPIERDTRRLNEAFLATPQCTHSIHEKRYLPDEDGFWEAAWYAPGDGVFDAVRADDAVLGVQICTELWRLDLSRHYGLRGADVIVVPRATPASSRERWIVGARAAAIVSGAFCVSSNRCGTSAGGDVFAGEGWIVDPDGAVLALTSDADPFVTLDLDLGHARAAKGTYPRYVR
ncbi:MAG TPA: carbon-nitrogen hydrolase family protein [Gemmatimonadaceae bacterium]